LIAALGTNNCIVTAYINIKCNNLVTVSDMLTQFR